MARIGLSLLFSFFVLYLNVITESAAARAKHANPTQFIKASCMATRYPALCIQCLSGYATSSVQNHHQLAQTALSVSLDRARSAEGFVNKLRRFRGLKPRESLALKDCIKNMGDSVDRLSTSMKELNDMDKAVGDDFLWHMSNVQTWVSAALTDESTCLDGFQGRLMDGNIKLAIRRRITSVAQVTSNALALVNQFAERRNSKRNP